MVTEGPSPGVDAEAVGVSLHVDLRLQASHAEVPLDE